MFDKCGSNLLCTVYPKIDCQASGYKKINGDIKPKDATWNLNIAPIAEEFWKKFMTGKNIGRIADPVTRPITETPTVGVAVIVMKDDRILLVKRLGSYEGMWSYPLRAFGMERRCSPGRQKRSARGNRIENSHRARVYRSFQFP